MRRWFFTLALAVGLPSLGAAQTVGSYPWKTPQRPTISPYLNLTRGGGTAGVNLYTLIRPQLETQKNFALLGQEINQLLPGVADPAHEAAATGYTGQTGGVAGFLNYGGYFPQMPAGGVGPFRR